MVGGAPRLLPGQHCLSGIGEDRLILFSRQVLAQCGKQLLGRFLRQAAGRRVAEQANLDAGQRIRQQPPAEQRHAAGSAPVSETHESAQDALCLRAVIAGRHGVPECQMNIAAQFDLEIQRVGLDRVELREKVL